LIVFCLFVPIALLGGFRSTFVLLLMTIALLFYLERLHQTRLLVPAVFAFFGLAGLLAVFAPQLPLPIQRSLAVVPFIQIDPLVRLDAESSTGWRLEVWRDTLPEVPQHLLIGKGYGFSAAEQFDLRNQLAGTEMVGNYHNGPLSVIIPFGILGAIGFVWFVVAGLRVFHQNYQFGDPALHYINAFLFAYFIAKIIFFFGVFGSFHSDMPLFLGMVALSISLNGGVAKPVVVPQPQIVFNRFKLHPTARRPVGAEP
jgi:O-antigen ligase